MDVRSTPQRERQQRRCLPGLDADGKPVIDLIGGPGKTGFNRYHITSDDWTMVPFPAGFPSTGLAGVDVVSMLRHTGENVCCLSGGLSAGYRGDSNALYDYHPATGELFHLGDFTYASPGVSRHFSWYVPWVGGGAICIAGGMAYPFQSYADSQCYMLEEKTFNAPNADLGPLPQAWSAGGDAWKVHEGEYRIWGFNGQDHNLAPLQASLYATPGETFTLGPAPAHAVAQVEGDNWNGTVWAANGRDSGFMPTAHQQ